MCVASAEKSGWSGGGCLVCDMVDRRGSGVEAPLLGKSEGLSVADRLAEDGLLVLTESRGVSLMARLLTEEMEPETERGVSEPSRP